MSDDDFEDVTECEGTKLVASIMNTMKKTCSLLLLSPNTDVKHGTIFIEQLTI